VSISHPGEIGGCLTRFFQPSDGRWTRPRRPTTSPDHRCLPPPPPPPQAPTPSQLLRRRRGRPRPKSAGLHHPAGCAPAAAPSRPQPAFSVGPAYRRRPAVTVAPPLEIPNTNPGTLTRTLNSPV
jgi:hypothetical protein